MKLSTRQITITETEDALTEDITQADLSKYPEHQLEGRLTHYEREHLFETDPDTREALKVEIERTETELKRRKMYRRAEADRVFTL